ncbi:MAG: peptidylprolyl isomerase [Planctomycetes bacterium]|nr:peptidylprolyl isomerase [Planctomycetota bacterium]
MRNRLGPTFLALLLGTPLAAQGSEPEPQQPPDPAAAERTDPPQKLAWPRDAERAIARVGTEELTLGRLIDHLDDRHFPGMRRLMETDAGRGYLESPIAAAWVRQYADVIALEREAASRGIDYEDAREALGAALKAAFEDWLHRYSEARERRGRPLELDQARVDLLLTQFQRDEGLGTELKGWLDVLVPPVDPEAVGLLRQFYTDHPQYFGGVVSAAQIFVRHRDPETLELYRGEARRAAYERLAEIRARLASDGSNFEEVARAFSEDRRTAAEGGLLSGIRRFDDRLPAALCRTVWSLRDGEISEPFESPYGIHIVKRLGYQHLYYVIFNEKIQAEIAATMQRKAQEDLLFDVRERYGVTLLY